jgi:hypothetical protein
MGGAEYGTGFQPYSLLVGSMGTGVTQKEAIGMTRRNRRFGLSRPPDIVKDFVQNPRANR